MSQTSEPTEHAIGAHSVIFEEPDIFVFRHVGDMDVAQMTTFLDLVDKFVTGKRAVFAIIDQSAGGGIGSDSRRMLLGRLSRTITGLAFISNSVVSRVGISLGYKAYLMMSRGKEVPHTFATTEADARAWIAGQRQQAAST